MAQLIKNRRLTNDSWQLLEGGLERWLPRGDDGRLAAFPDAGDLIVPLELWLARREDLLARSGRVGVLLQGHDEPERIAADLEHFDVVAVNFAQFADGRGYSLARLLRERHGYRGELRATGDVLRDQLYYLSRCGFDAFALREDQDANEALLAFRDFSEDYQASVERPPLFRRRVTESRT